MRKTSRVVTAVEGIEVIEVTREDLEGFPLETTYYVHGERYRTLQEARQEARKIAEELKRFRGEAET
jgi:hypothetical protein